MAPTTTDNANKIDKLEKKVDNYKDNHGETHREIATSMGVIEGTMLSMNSTLSNISADLTNTNKIIPNIDFLCSEIQTIKSKQDEIGKFRWRIDGGKIILASIISIAITVSGLVWGWSEFGDRYINKQDVPVEILLDNKTHIETMEALCSDQDNKTKKECYHYIQNTSTIKER